MVHDATKPAMAPTISPLQIFGLVRLSGMALNLFPVGSRYSYFFSLAASYACWRKSATATAVNTPLTNRVTRGAKTKPKPKPAATHGAEHHWHVTRSPIARCKPWPLDFSTTSPPPADS